MKGSLRSFGSRKVERFWELGQGERGGEREGERMGREVKVAEGRMVLRTSEGLILHS